MVVLDLDRAVFDLFRGGIRQRAHAARHRVALNVAIAPAGDVEHHVLGSEIVAVRPFHALADVEGELGRVVIGNPVVQQHAAEGAVGVVFNEVFQPTTGEVGNLRPVGHARIFQRAGRHVHAQRATGLRRGGIGHRGGRVQTDHAIGGSGRDAKRGGAGKELTPAQRAVAVFVGIHLRRRVQRCAFGLDIKHLSSPCRSCCSR
ncbi:hypothetical protein GALL_464970 [mine drainage metagenome]|uniref:Uncharacterized protein n=1 Tax=mine drainage metagenome TaxID=410659 RepID=A0A1J5Q7G9_9ZZZZ